MLSKLEWLNLSIPTRSLLVQRFNIPKSGYTHVQDGQILTDGYTEQDLQVVTVERLQEYLESKETDFYKLLAQTVQKLEEEERIKAEELAKEAEALANPSQLQPLEVKEEVKLESKRGRPKKILAL